ncbi:LysR family transcriptional regulator [Cupriavidus gilardii]|uniref:LysR substrate-binding domain-containing protein n=1 Tax=Cupriavidus gilardii TaxID=82541 RepID=UPI001EE5ED4E|nr:LysR substrate-binding domain-containing protein [Cupriavidus gilardii]MCG5263171.1 LysR substrate-binding domain-containing protein [Cupriavidus gilardii]MDF9432864.1 LysR family transcriptional regulator [Cupriavidus gilardii]
MALNLDIAALRSLVAGIDLGSFARAADQVGRSTSAVSAQIHKLEDMAGTPLFRKAGRTLELTEAGNLLLGYARRIVALNDEAAAAVRGVDLSGGVRLGLQEEFGEATLPEVLGRFARAHPKVRVEAMVARNHDLFARIQARTLDLALVWGGANGAAAARAPGADITLVGEPQMCWVGPATLPWRLPRGEPVPLAVFDRPCHFHDAATAALDRAGIPWRISFTSPNLGGLWAAAAAGLGLVVRTPYGLPASLRQFGAADGLPPLGKMPLMLLRAPGPASEVSQRLADIMLEALRPV